MSASPSNPAIAFKEWAFVCEALGQGVQTIILRKGGIHEGKGGFSFQHESFWLFPTGFHAQKEQLRWIPENAADMVVPPDETRELVELRYFAKLHGVWKITDWDTAAALAPFHVWKEEVVRERFAWGGDTCLHVALARVYAAPEVWTLPYERSYGGCRSWLKLPVAPDVVEDGLRPAMEDASWEAAAGKIRSLLGQREKSPVG